MSFLLFFPLFPLNPLLWSLCPHTPTLSQAGWASGAEKDLQATQSDSHTSFHMGVSIYRRGSSFFFFFFFKPITFPFFWWYTAWSGMFSFLSSPFFAFWMCRSVWSDRNTFFFFTDLQKQKPLHWNNCDLLLLLLFFLAYCFILYW